MRRYFLAVGASLSVLAFFGLLYLVGYLEPLGVVVATVGTLSRILAYYVAVRTGFNLRFQDPSLTRAQMVSASAVICATAFFIKSEVRDIVLPILLMVFYFGIYRLDTRAMTHMALVAIGFYGAMLAMLYGLRPHSLMLPLDLLNLLILAVVTLWFGTVGGHVTRLRRELALRKDAIEALLERDDLTGVGNRRFLTHMLEQEKSRAERSGGTFCVAMLDLDHFKMVNDTYGHPAGDKILKTFAQVAQVGLRKIDYFGRYGGEEFTLIMSDTDLVGARVTTERLRRDLENTRFAEVDAAHVQTVSIGIAEYRRGESIEQIQLRADKAMYKAKAKGRNRIEVDDEAPRNTSTPLRTTQVA